MSFKPKPIFYPAGDHPSNGWAVVYGSIWPDRAYPKGEKPTGNYRTEYHWFYETKPRLGWVHRNSTGAVPLYRIKITLKERNAA